MEEADSRPPPYFPDLDLCRKSRREAALPQTVSVTNTRLVDVLFGRGAEERSGVGPHHVCPTLVEVVTADLQPHVVAEEAGLHRVGRRGQVRVQFRAKLGRWARPRRLVEHCDDRQRDHVCTSVLARGPPGAAHKHRSMPV